MSVAKRVKKWNDELRAKLLEFGFLDVTGFMEKIKGKLKRVPVVVESKRNEWGGNNGIWLVIDNNGHSWICPATALGDDGRKFLHDYFPLHLGCHVPFSNDGGKFAREVWPWAYKDQES
jgi:hypothetical protein